jgi:hypothetical protein
VVSLEPDKRSPLENLVWLLLLLICPLGMLLMGASVWVANEARAGLV